MGVTSLATLPHMPSHCSGSHCVRDTGWRLLHDLMESHSCHILSRGIISTLHSARPNPALFQQILRFLVCISQPYALLLYLPNFVFIRTHQFMHASEYSDKTSMARGHVSLGHHNQTRTFYTTKLVFLCCKK